MSSSAKETILNALKDVIQTAFSSVYALEDVSVLRNAEIPEEVGEGGLVIIRDGDPGQPEQALGGFSHCYYAHEVSIEVIVQSADQEERDSLYDQILTTIGSAIEADKTLGSLIFGLDYGQPSPLHEAIDGAGDLKACELTLMLEYETETPLG